MALLLERIVELRTADPWRNVRAQLERIQVVEYDHGDARIRQCTELRPEVTTLLRKLKVPAPPKLQAIDRLPAVGTFA